MALAIDPELPQADIVAIKRMIPHRYPFLLIDRVVNIEVNRYAVGLKNVTINEPHFEGHFPVLPVMPGVLIVEAMAQTSAVLVVETLDLIDKDLLVYFMSIDNTKFRKAVTPGDRLELHVTVARTRGKVWRFTGGSHMEDAPEPEPEDARPDLRFSTFAAFFDLLPGTRRRTAADGAERPAIGSRPG